MEKHVGIEIVLDKSGTNIDLTSANADMVYGVMLQYPEGYLEEAVKMLAHEVERQNKTLFPLKVAMPCGETTTFPNAASLGKDALCPCGNETHFLIKHNVILGTKANSEPTTTEETA